MHTMSVWHARFVAVTAMLSAGLVQAQCPVPDFEEKSCTVPEAQPVPDQVQVDALKAKCTEWYQEEGDKESCVYFSEFALNMMIRESDEAAHSALGQFCPGVFVSAAGGWASLKHYFQENTIYCAEIVATHMLNAGHGDGAGGGASDPLESPHEAVQGMWDAAMRPSGISMSSNKEEIMCRVSTYISSYIFRKGFFDQFVEHLKTSEPRFHDAIIADAVGSKDPTSDLDVNVRVDVGKDGDGEPLDVYFVKYANHLLESVFSFHNDASSADSIRKVTAMLENPSEGESVADVSADLDHMLSGSTRSEDQQPFVSEDIKGLLAEAQIVRDRVAYVAHANYEGQSPADVANRKLLHSLHSRDSCRALQTTVSGYFDLVLYATDFAFDQKKVGLSGGKELTGEKAMEQYKQQQVCWPEQHSAGGAADPTATGGDAMCPYHTILAGSIYKALQAKHAGVKTFAMRLATMHQWDGLVAVLAKARLLLPEEYCKQIVEGLRHKLVLSNTFYDTADKHFMKEQLEKYKCAALREASLIAADVTEMILSRCSSVVTGETTSTFAGGSDSYHAYFGEPAGLDQLRAIPEELAAYCRQGAYEASLDERSAALQQLYAARQNLYTALVALKKDDNGRSTSLRGALPPAGPATGAGAGELGAASSRSSAVEQVDRVTITNFQLAVFEAVASLPEAGIHPHFLNELRQAYGRVLYYRSLSALLASEAYATEGSVDTAVYLWGQGMVAMPLPIHEIASAAAENFLDSIRLSLDISPDNYAIGSGTEDLAVIQGAGVSAQGASMQVSLPGIPDEEQPATGAVEEEHRLLDYRSLYGGSRSNRHRADQAEVAADRPDLDVLDSIVHSAKYLERAGKAMAMLRATSGQINSHLNYEDARAGMMAAAVQDALKCAADASISESSCSPVSILRKVLFDNYGPPEGDAGSDKTELDDASKLFKALQPGLSLLWHLSRTEVAGVRLYAPVAKILTDMYKKRHPFADLSREDRGRVLCGQWAAAEFPSDSAVKYPRVLRSGAAQGDEEVKAKQLLPFGCAGAAHTSYYTSLVTLVTTMVRLGAANTLEQLGYMPSNGIEAAIAAGGSAGGDGRDAEHPSGLCEPRTIDEAVRFPAECMFERLRPPAPTPTSTPTPTPTPTTTPSSSATPSGTPSCTPSPSETPSSSPTPSVMTPSPSAASDGCCTIS